MATAFTLKNIKTFRGMEGHGFNATMYLEGKKIGLVMDAAHGGMMDFEFDSKELEEKFNAYVAALPPSLIENEEHEWAKTLYIDGKRSVSADELIENALEAIEQEKFDKKFLTFKTKGKEMQCPIKNSVIKALKAEVLRQIPDAVFTNHLDA